MRKISQQPSFSALELRQSSYRYTLTAVKWPSPVIRDCGFEVIPPWAGNQPSLITKEGPALSWASSGESQALSEEKLSHTVGMKQES